MADWFNFKDVRSNDPGAQLDLGVHVMEYPPLTVPPERVEFTPVLGRSGSLTRTEGDGVYEDIILPISCFVSDLSQVDRIAAWLRGSGNLILGNAPDRFYKARVVNQIDIRRIIRNSPYQAFSAMFRCKPYRYWYPSSPVTVHNGDTLTNGGNVYSEPMYTIQGTGDISITIDSADGTERTIGINDLNGFITIDMEMRLAYVPNSYPLIPMTESVGKATWPFILPIGDNVITWEGDISSFTIEPRWRDV